MFKRFLSFTLFLPLLLAFDGWGQTNPAAQSLPFSVNFGTATFTSMPTGTASWNGVNGTACSTLVLAEASAPTGNAPCSTATASSTTGGTYGYATSSNGRVYIQTSTNATNGVNQVAFAINTGLTTSLRIAYTMELIQAQPRTFGSVLQYRLATGGAWTTVSGSGVTYKSGTTNGGDADGAGDIDSYAFILTGLSANTDYVFRFAHWRGNEGGNSSGLLYDDLSVTAAEPTSDATFPVFSNIAQTGLTLSWTNGNGANRLVLVKAGSAVDATPVDGTAYTANSAFGTSGTQIGTGNYAVYSGSGNSVDISGLSASTTYHIAVFEFNGSGTASNYKTDAPLRSSQATSSAGTPTISLSVSSLAFGNLVVSTESAAQSFEVSGSDLDGSDVYVSCPTDFLISQDESGVYSTDDIILSYSSTELLPTLIYVKFAPDTTGSKSESIAISGGGVTPVSVTVTGKALSLEPTTQATAATVASSSDVTLSLNWTKGNGDNRIVLMKQGSAVDASPVDGTSYSANLAFGTGSEIGTGNRVVYAGSDPKPITVTGLTAGETYQIAVFEYNGSGGTENYLTTSPATASGATLKITPGAVATTPFCVDATSTASGTIAFTVTGVFGAANDYTAWLSDALGSFTSEINIGTLENTTGNGTINITIPAGTATGTGYKIRIKSNDPTEIISGASAAFTILNGPQDVTSTVATNANLQSVLSWTNPAGCFDEILIVGKSGEAVTLAPSGDGSAYTGSLTFGSGTPYGGGFVIYKGISSPQTVTNLTNDITYHFTFFTRSGTAWSAGVMKTANPSSGTLLLEENFNYTNVSNLTANGWTAHSSSGTNPVKVGTSNGLSFQDYGPVSVSNAGVVNNSGEDVHKKFVSEINSGIVYAAFLLKADKAATGGDYLAHLGPTTINTDFKGRVYIKQNDASTFYFGVSKAGTTVKYTSSTYNYNTVYLLVLKYKINSGASDDEVFLQVYSAGQDFTVEPETYTLSAATNESDVANLGTFALRQVSTSYGITIDAIRVSTGWFGASGALPVELTSFTARAQGTSVTLNWETKTEIDNNGFEVERNANGAWQKIGFVEGHGTANSPKYYSFSDANPLGNKIQYRLKQIDNDGDFEYSDVVEVELAPVSYTLYQNYPNPFNPSTVIRYALPAAGMVSIDVFNALGEKVATLLNGEVEAGYNQVSFDATNLPSGLYFYRIQSGDFTSIKKMLLMK